MTIRYTTILATIALLATPLGGCNKDTGSAQNDAATCTPTTCAAQGKNCGTIMDQCGGELDCGQCTAPQFCGGGGVANVCGDGPCTPTNCVTESAACGQISDGCATVLDCGTCSAPAICGGGGTPNQCDVPSQLDAGTPGPDGGSTGLCDSTCMAQSGAVCCETCGCNGATVRCDPICESPYVWDCEMSCCFDYSGGGCQ